MKGEGFILTSSGLWILQGQILFCRSQRIQIPAPIALDLEDQCAGNCWWTQSSPSHGTIDSHFQNWSLTLLFGGLTSRIANLTSLHDARTFSNRAASRLTSYMLQVKHSALNKKVFLVLLRCLTRNKTTNPDTDLVKQLSFINFLTRSSTLTEASFISHKSSSFLARLLQLPLWLFSDDKTIRKYMRCLFCKSQCSCPPTPLSYPPHLLSIARLHLLGKP